MKRITGYEESLNIVRAKCESKNTDFTKEELKHLSLANIELQKSYGKKFVKPLDKSCSYCVITAMNCIHNYIMFEEPKVKVIYADTLEELEHKTTKIKEEFIDSSESIIESIIEAHKIESPDIVDCKPPQESIEDLAKLPLKELRKKFPNIKARSIDRFIELLKAE